MRKPIWFAPVAFLGLLGNASAAQQIVEHALLPAPPGEVLVQVSYSTANPVDETLTGLGLRLHWDSDAVEFIELTDVFPTDFVAQGTLELDISNLDASTATDHFVGVAWADIDGNWPGVGSTPLPLFTARFALAPGSSGPSEFGFSFSSVASESLLLVFADGFESGDVSAWTGPYLPEGTPLGPEMFSRSEGFAILQQLVALGDQAALAPLPFPGAFLDVDDNGTISPVTDGTLILRYLFGFRGDVLIDGAVAPGAARTTAAEVESYLISIEGGLDVDGDGRRDALTDGILILRYLWGFRGEALVQGALGAGALRQTAEDIEVQLDGLTDPAGQSDSDGDGLIDAAEVGGYEILIDVLGLGPEDPGWFSTLERRFVTSDPFDPNSDEDSLTDPQEKLFKTDPRDDDTDDDGLNDGEELNRWGSTPTSVDSDGDARGPRGPNNEPPVLNPNPAFFDGNELGSYGTSPALDDTDGDNRIDFVEVLQLNSPPLIASVPAVAVELVGDITIELDTEATEEQASSFGSSDLRARTDTSGVSRVDSRGSRWAVSASATVRASSSVTGEAGLPPGVSATAEVSAETTVSGEYSQDRSASFTEDSSVATQDQLELSRNQALLQSETITGGRLGGGVKICNAGDIAFTLSDLVVTALVQDPDDRRDFSAVATLLPDLNGPDEPGGSVTLGPFFACTGPIEVEDRDVPARRATSLMADPSGLYLNVTSFSIEDEEGRNFVFLSEVTNARTALVTIDFGDGTVERHRVAAFVERNPDGTGAGVRMGDVLDSILDIRRCLPSDGPEADCFQTEPRIGSVNPDFPNGVRILTRVRRVATSVDPNPFAGKNSYWAVLSEDSELTGQPGAASATDFEDIRLQSGDAISLVYLTDADQDGLFRREEFLLGTIDEPDLDENGLITPVELAIAKDFDGDQLDDFFEAKTGWIVTDTAGTQRRVFSDPTQSNIDGDRFRDDAELKGPDGLPPDEPGDSGDATDPRETAFPDDALYYKFDSTLTSENGTNDGEDVGITDVSYAADRFGELNGALCLQVPDSCSFVKFPDVPLGSEFTLVTWAVQSSFDAFANEGLILGPATFSTPDRHRTLEILENTNAAQSFDVHFMVSDEASDTIDLLGEPLSLVPSLFCNAATLAEWSLVAATVASQGANTIATLYQAAGDEFSVRKAAEPESVTGPYVPLTVDLFMGGAVGPDEGSCFTQNFQGQFDDLRIYDRALSRRELDLLLNERKTP